MDAALRAAQAKGQAPPDQQQAGGNIDAAAVRVSHASPSLISEVPDAASPGSGGGAAATDATPPTALAAVPAVEDHLVARIPNGIPAVVHTCSPRKAVAAGPATALSPTVGTASSGSGGATLNSARLVIVSSEPIWEATSAAVAESKTASHRPRVHNQPRASTRPEPLVVRHVGGASRNTLSETPSLATLDSSNLARGLSSEDTAGDDSLPIYSVRAFCFFPLSPERLAQCFVLVQ